MKRVGGKIVEEEEEEEEKEERKHGDKKIGKNNKTGKTKIFYANKKKESKNNTFDTRSIFIFI